jgi:hypothetical protein
MELRKPKKFDKGKHERNVIWLHRFIELWSEFIDLKLDKDEVRKNEKHLCALYEKYLEKENLPKLSADEVLCEISY